MRKLFVIVVLMVASMINAQNPLPITTSSLFSGSGNCATCHTGSGTVLTQNGADISPVTMWRSSMMANSSKDPLWRAVVGEEVTTFPDYKGLIENTCTRCHAPMGNEQQAHDSTNYYTIAHLENDPQGNDGVSCTLCHQVDGANMGDAGSYSGGYVVTDDRIIYGPYANPFTGSMVNQVNYTPVESAHVNNSELCATCHTLFTPTLGGKEVKLDNFPEQTPYQEWKNSVYEAEGTECQDCHMPSIDDPIDIASMPPWHTTERSPYWKHEFAGGNVLMLRMLRDNSAELGVTADAEHYDSTITWSQRNMESRAVRFVAEHYMESDSMNIKVTIENKAGHKLPTGIPLRRLWIHLKVEDESGNNVFESGEYTPEGVINDVDDGYEPHYSVINSPDQVQIYEGVFEDNSGNVTHTLLKAAIFKKDNRIPPKGFTSLHASYDTTKIYGLAAEDDNFNAEEGVEGTGSDIIIYKIPAEINKTYKVFAELLYQPVKQETIHHLEEVEHPDTEHFIELYENADRTPVTLATVSLNNIALGFDKRKNDFTEPQFRGAYPNPFNPSTKISFALYGESKVTLEIYDITGRLVSRLIDNYYMPAGEYYEEFRGDNLSSGIYISRISVRNMNDGKTYHEVSKLMLLK